MRSIVAVALGFVLCAPAYAASGSTTFVQTNTLGYTAAEYTDLGPAALTKQLALVIGLTPRNTSEIPVLLQRMVTPG
ncbi:MAG: hypothetical protein IAI48_02570, partial [Candidatus Eremiobacteraeota bacterium]|nr:hypothetical protein [Candidatus Eremiobacteraeota bacterium]